MNIKISRDPSTVRSSDRTGLGSGLVLGSLKISTSKRRKSEIILQAVFVLILQYVSLSTIKVVLIDAFSSVEFLLFRDSLK